MTPFVLYRIEDETGVSGTGIVAEGVIFTDGKVAMRWLTNTSSTAFYDSINDVQFIHGHNGKTEMHNGFRLTTQNVEDQYQAMMAIARREWAKIEEEERQAREDEDQRANEPVD